MMFEKRIEIGRQIQLQEMEEVVFETLAIYRKKSPLAVECFLLREIGGISRKQVALLQGCSVGAISHRVQAVKKHLRIALDDFRDYDTQ